MANQFYLLAEAAALAAAAYMDARDAAAITLAQAAAMAAKDYTGARNTAFINAVFRAEDESHLSPIDGRFNAADRAIRRVSKQFIELGIPRVGYEYAIAVDCALDNIFSEYS